MRLHLVGDFVSLHDSTLLLIEGYANITNMKPFPVALGVIDTICCTVLGKGKPLIRFFLLKKSWLLKL